MMMKFDQKCIMCESPEDLNTTMSVKIENEKYDVAICDEHADNATPKKIKEVVSSKLEELKSLMEKMKEFGLEVNMSGGGVAVAEKKPEESIDDAINEEIHGQEEQEVAKPKVSKAGTNKKIIVAKKKNIDEKPTRKPQVNRNIGTPRSLGGPVKGIRNTVNLEQRQAIDAREAINSEVNEAKKKGEEVVTPITEDIEYQVVAGRAGAPMTIPKKIKHNMGSTQIAVVDTGGDKTIQTRFKEMAENSKMDNAHVYGRDGYDTYSCTMCEGSGIAKIGGGRCEKCKGIGLLNRGGATK